MLFLRPTLVLRNAQVNKNQLLNRLLPIVGDLQSARNELRWLQEDCQKRLPESEQQSSLQKLVERRSRGEPLQYILGSAYFGDLEIKCRPNVFIPRPETAASVSYLVKALVAQIARHNAFSDVNVNLAHTRRLKEPNGSNVVQRRPDGRSFVENDRETQFTRRDLARVPKTLRVSDLCTGSGCIPLLFWHQYYNSVCRSDVDAPDLEIAGCDMSSDALDLARENQGILEAQQPQQDRRRQRALQSLQHMKFIRANVLREENSTEDLGRLISLRRAIEEHSRNHPGKDSDSKSLLENDIWISNPPYISPESYVKNTEKSVRDFEPKAALVPPLTSVLEARTAPATGNEGDRFHQDILEQAIEMRIKVVLLEVDDIDQATRVVKLAASQKHWHTCEIWRDEPDANAPVQHLNLEGQIVTVYGLGEGRSVLMCTRNGADLIGRYPPTVL